MSLYLGIDLGTQSLKCLVYDAETRRVVARSAHPCAAPQAPRTGAAEQDPADWWQALEQALPIVLATEGVDAARLRGLGVSGQQHGLVALDEAGAVLRPAKLWCDVEAVAEATALSAASGRAVPPGFTAPKLLWMKAQEPELFAQLHRVCLPHDWLNLQLSGVWATDHGDASGNGLYDPLVGDYDAQAVAWVDAKLSDKLPPLNTHDVWHGTLLPNLAQKFGLPEGLQIAVGSGDNMMSALGAGACRDGVLVVSLGTSGTLFGRAAQPIVDPDGHIAPFRDATGGGLPLYCIQNCTTVTEEVRQAFGLSLKELTHLAEAEPAGEGPLFLPYLTGERSPDWPLASGVLHGLRPGDLKPGRVFRAAMEGVSFALYAGATRLAKLGLTTKELRLVGGGAQNSLWQQMLSDVFDTPVLLPTEPDSAALGAALQALASDAPDFHGALADHTPPVQDSAIDPNPALTPVYRAAAERHRSLGETLFG